jgi:ribosomal protein S18 acetylase RimI-like enzyme
MGATIRSFSAADSGSVNAVALAAFAQYEGVYSDWETLTRSVGAMAALADQAEIVVAEEGGTIVGAVAYVPPGAMPRAEFFDPGWAIVRMLVVDPVARGSGLGRRLTEACVERARRDGAATLALHTSPAMHAALALYLKMGFELERRLPDRFGVPYAVYLMDLRKAPPP